MVTTLELQRRGLPYAVVVDGAATPASLADLDDKGLPYLVEVADGATMASRRALEARGLRYLVPVLVDATSASKASLDRQGLRYAVQVDGDILPADRLVLQRQGLACYVEVDSSGNSVSAAAVGGAALLTGEANGFAADFTHPVNAERVAVKTAGTVVSSSTSFFTSSGTSSKWIYDINGTLANVAVGTLPLDYDPVTHAARGLLCEPAATNLANNSQDLSATVTAEGGAVTINNQTGPDGLLTADTYTENTATFNHGCYGQVGGATASADYTLSRYMKMGTRRYASLGWSDGTNGSYAVYDLQAGSVGSSAAFGTGTLTSASIQACANGWYRCVLVGRHPATTAYYTQQAASAATITVDGFGRQSFLGTGATLFMGHVQVEAGTVATSPIPTAASSATRAVDSYNCTAASVGNSATAGSWWVEMNHNVALAGTPRIIGTNAAASPLYYTAATTPGLLDTTGMTKTTTTIVGSTHKVASAYASGDRAVSADGLAAATDAGATSGLLGPTTIFLGNGSSTPMSGYIRKVRYLPRRPTNAELAAMTT